MRLPKSLKVSCSLFMTVWMTNLPSIAAAEIKMVPTESVVAKLSQAEERTKIQSLLDRQDVRSELIRQGVSPEEASLRLASLNEVELKQLAGQVEQARAGGDILITILIVVLIIFLIKRM